MSATKVLTTVRGSLEFALVQRTMEVYYTRSSRMDILLETKLSLAAIKMA